MIRKANRYRNLSMELRAIAEWKLTAECRALTLRMADQYEQLALAAEQIASIRADALQR
jgi:hypothetical protein